MARKPSQNRVSSPYGPRVHPITLRPSFHTGQDHSSVGPSGLSISAPTSGIITFDGSYGGYGQAMILESGVTRHLFGHTALVADANVGDRVREGQIIATIGTTGNSTGPHLHWEVQVNNVRIDPAAWLTSVAGLTLIPIEEEEMPYRGQISPIRWVDAEAKVTDAVLFDSPNRGLIYVRNPYEYSLINRYLGAKPDQMFPAETELLNYYLVIPTDAATVFDTAPLQAVIRAELAKVGAGITVDAKLTDAQIAAVSKAVNDEFARRAQS